MGNVLVVSGERGEGKSAIAAALAHRAIESGRKAAAIRPLGGPDEAGEGSDAAAFERLLGPSASGPTAPVPEGGLDEGALGGAARACADLGADAVFAECSSDLSTGDAARLADALDAQVVVTVRHRHGMSAADVAGRFEPLSARMAGVILNARGTHMGTESAALASDLEAGGMRVLGTIPEDRRLLGVTVRTVAGHLGGRFVLGEDDGADRLVEHFLVGGWMMDEGALYFSTRDRKAVLIRGDRPDIQMSALSTPTSVLVLTGGIEPIEYVLYEAGEEEVALVVVDQGTVEAMESLGTVVESARFDHPDKLARLSDLLDRHADAAALAGLG